MQFSLMFVVTSLQLGGAETQVVNLARGHAERGTQVAVVSLLGPGALGERVREAGIPLYCLNMPRGVPHPSGIFGLRRAIRQFKPTIVHGHMFHANLLTRAMRVICPMPVLVNTVHSLREASERFGGASAKEFAYKWTDGLCDLTTTIAEAATRRHIAIGAVPAHKIKTVHNGIFIPPEERYRNKDVRSRVRRDLGITDEFVWLSVGRFVPVKDFPNILTAFFEVARLNSKMSTLLIAGDGPLRSEMQEFASREGLGDRVRFLGPRNDIGDLMTASDGLVLASQEEGLSLVLLEAASHGLPIVATDVGGNRETIPEENTGYLVPARDSHALADAMQALMNLPDEMRLAVGHRARKNAERRFALSEILNEWEEVYRELLGRRGLPDNLIAKRAAAD